MIKAVNNRIQLIGFLGGAVSYLPRTFDDNTVKLRAILATHERRRIKTLHSKGIESVTVWHNLVAHGKVAKAMADVLKGEKLFVEGRLVYQNTFNLATSTHHTVTNIEVLSFHKLKTA